MSDTERTQHADPLALLKDLDAQHIKAMTAPERGSPADVLTWAWQEIDRLRGEAASAHRAGALNVLGKAYEISGPMAGDLTFGDLLDEFPDFREEFINDK